MLACGDSGDSQGRASNDGDGGPGDLPDADVIGGDTGAPGTTLRLAHVASDLGPVDFCYHVAKTSSFEGPVLGGGVGAGTKDAGDAGDAGDASDDASPGTDDAGDDDGGDAGAGPPSVAYRSVSKYLQIDASGPLTIALVAPGATSCATPLFTADVTLDPGKLSTVVIVGRQESDASATQLALVAFTDDRMKTPEKARVRMIHAASGKGLREASDALAVRAAGAQIVTVAERVEPKKAASPSAAVPVDSLGYATIAPLPSPAELAVGAAAGTMPSGDASADSWLSAPAELGLFGGSLHTGFILTGESDAFEVLWCTDTSTSGERTTCALVR